MVERLETLTRQLGLKFMSSPDSRDYFISSDMFYVEVSLDPQTGFVNDVSVAHQGEPSSCPELTKVLREGDFIAFTEHLNGLSCIYQLSADSKTKSKAYLALHSLENDLNILSQLQSSADAMKVIVGPVGVYEGRRGGFPSRLTYFVSPYDLIDKETKTAIPLTVETVISKKIGFSASLCLESSNRSHKLQTTSLISISKSTEGKSLPQFAAVSMINSAPLPAFFLLKLDKPLPVSLETSKRISNVTGIDVLSEGVSSSSLITLIASSLLAEKEKSKLLTSKDTLNFFVKLPDQQHSYFIHHGVEESQAGHGHLSCLSLKAIPFTHPTHVPQILVFLRQQVLFNVILGSCVRKMSPFRLSEDDASFTFEVTSTSMTTVSVSFENPVEESLASLDIDLKDILSIKCKLYPVDSFCNLIDNDYVGKVLQKCLSIPVTLRMIIIKCRERRDFLKEEAIKVKEEKRAHDSIRSISMSGPPSTSSDSSINLDSTITSILQSQQFSSAAPLSRSLSTGSTPTSTPSFPVLEAKGTASGMAASLLLMSQSMTAAQKAAILQNLQYQQQMRQQQQSMSQQQSRQEQQNLTLQQQNKQNAMLLNMVRKDSMEDKTM